MPDFRKPPRADRGWLFVRFLGSTMPIARCGLRRPDCRKAGLPPLWSRAFFLGTLPPSSAALPETPFRRGVAPLRPAHVLGSALLFRLVVIPSASAMFADGLRNLLFPSFGPTRPSSFRIVKR